MNFYLLALFAIVTAIAVTIEHFTLGRMWRRNEAARRVMGHGTILLIAGAFIPSGLIALNTWFAFLVATVTAGAIVGGLQVHEAERRKEERARAAREVINNDGEENTRRGTRGI